MPENENDRQNGHALIRHPVNAPERKGSCTCGHVWNIEAVLPCALSQPSSHCPFCPIHSYPVRPSLDDPFMTALTFPGRTPAGTFAQLQDLSLATRMEKYARSCLLCGSPNPLTPFYGHAKDPTQCPQLKGWRCSGCHFFLQLPPNNT